MRHLAPIPISTSNRTRLFGSLLVTGAALILACAPQSLRAQSSDPPSGEAPMARTILVHITHGPEHPTRAALGFAVARAALEQGRQVSIFLAGDAVQLIRETVLDDLQGLGTGNLRELYDGIVADGGQFYLSGGSSEARGVTEEDIADRPAEFAGPPTLVQLSLEHDRMFTY